MKKFRVKAEINMYVTDEDIEDIMSNICDGDVSVMWCDNYKLLSQNNNCNSYYHSVYDWLLADDRNIIEWHDFEEDIWHQTSIEDLLDGIRICAEKQYGNASEWAKNGRIDLCEMDAIDGDCILQCAIFGDVIYG